MRRRRIREIVAAAVNTRVPRSTEADDVTLTVRRDRPRQCVTIDVGPATEGVHFGSSKVGALVAVLRWYVPGDWRWPPRTYCDRRAAEHRETLDILGINRADPYNQARIQLHLREPVALP